MEQMTKEEAENFFGELYYGKHHLPNEVKEFGYGWSMKASADLATTDFNNLTRLVLMAHRDAIRASIIPCTTGGSKFICIAIHKRKREGSLVDSHEDFIDKNRTDL